MNHPTVVVTGASRGLGAAIARLLPRLSASVVLNARSESDLDAIAGEIRSAGGRAEVVAGDISQPEICEQLVRTALGRFDRLDAVINNAAILEPVAPVAEADYESWARALAVNVIAPVLLSRAALPALRARQGRILNISSGAAIRPKTAWAAYNASKAALNQITATLAREEPAITALAVDPGIMDTEMQAVIRAQGRDKMIEAEYQRFANLFERGELGSPERPARSVVVLALHAPREWSGEFVGWNEDRVMDLVRLHTSE